MTAEHGRIETSQDVSMRPRARLVSILGEHLISDHVVGLLELAKNAYDADSAHVDITLKAVSNYEDMRITVQDDGFGMSARDVVEKFLSPAVDHKASAKEERRRTPAGRLPIGEKGVGRFAVQQLGHQLLLVTRAAGQPEVVVNIDWDQFDSGVRYLDEMRVRVHERQPIVFTGTQTGTRLVISLPRVAWTELMVQKLQRGLLRLQSPHASGGKRHFQIALHCPEYSGYEELDAGDILEHAHYRFSAAIDAGGLMDYEYAAHHPEVQQREVARQNYNLIQNARVGLSGPEPCCGAFYVELYVWDRTAQYLKQSGVARGDLDAMAGVSLFRDHIRVLPYGEAGDDWLQLDRDRINNPTERIGNNQVIGFVEVSQEQNPDLRDKTNREGLLENRAFSDLRTMARAAIAQFCTIWHDDRPGRRGSAARAGASPVEELAEVHTVAAAIEKSARSDISVELRVQDAPLGHLPRAAGNTDQTSDRQALNAPHADAFRIVSQQEASRALVAGIDRAIEAEGKQATAQEHQRDVLMHLASTGMAAERVVHEVGRQVVPALDAIEKIRKGETLGSCLNQIEACLGTLRNEFRALAPYEGVNRYQKNVSVDVKGALQTALLLNERAISQAHIETRIDGESFDVMARPASVVQVFDNLIHNACAWLHGNGARPHIHIVIDRRARTVVITDNGPGIAPEIAESIFDPFVTTRPGGRGLGLYISKQIVTLGGGSIRLWPGQPRASETGASFLVDLAGYPRPGAAVERPDQPEGGSS